MEGRLTLVLIFRLGRWRLDFFDQPQDFLEGGVFELLLFERRGAGEQLVEDDAEGIDVGAGIDVEVVELGLLGAHVERRADHQAVSRVERVLGQRLAAWPWPGRSR